MSTQSVALNNGQQAIINTDTSKIFLWNRRSIKGILNNSFYGPLTYRIGTVMGRVATTGLMKPFTSTASDGSQIPIGILIMDYVVPGSANQTIYIVDDGDVAEEQLVFFNGFDTPDTNAGGMLVRDRLKQAGVKLIQRTEMTNYDNQ